MATAFLVAFFAAGFLATAFLVAFFAAGFLAAAFFTAFFAAGFFAAAFLAAGFAAFFTAFLAAGFFAAAFFVAMEWLLVNGYFGNAQFHKTPQVSDLRSTASARRAPERMRCPGTRKAVRRPVTSPHEKTCGAWRCRF